ncbi:MAG: type II toxin-antitoxin system RelE/ParE family toxin [Solidesulfovibrio sp.]
MKPITVVETPEFIRRAKAILSEEERLSFIDHIARHYHDGVRIEGTGGLRKIRWARKNEGKSGGYRVVYYFYDVNFPVFLITIYAKNAQENISNEERNELKKLSSLLISAYKKQRF